MCIRDRYITNKINDNGKKLEVFQEENKKSIESLKKEISSNYETVNQKIDDNKVDSDRRVETMVKQLERLQEGNDTHFETMEERTVETKQSVQTCLLYTSVKLFIVQMHLFASNYRNSF